MLVIDAAVSERELAVRPALLSVQAHRAELPFTDHRSILLGGQELQAHHERIVTPREVVDPPLGQIQHASLLTGGAELDVSQELAAGAGRLPSDEGVVLLGCDQAQGFLEPFAVAGAPLLGRAVGVGDDLADVPDLLVTP